MKLSQKIMISLVVLGLSLPSSSVLFAHEGHHGAAFIKLLQDSAAALQSSQPALSADLTKFATEETNEKEGKEKHTPEEAAAAAAHVKLLQDAAAALQSSHPELAAKLTKKAEHKEMKMSDKKY